MRDIWCIDIQLNDADAEALAKELREDGFGAVSLISSYEGTIVNVPFNADPDDQKMAQDAMDLITAFVKRLPSQDGRDDETKAQDSAHDPLTHVRHMEEAIQAIKDLPVDILSSWGFQKALSELDDRIWNVTQGEY